MAKLSVVSLFVSNCRLMCRVGRAGFKTSAIEASLRWRVVCRGVAGRGRASGTGGGGRRCHQRRFLGPKPDQWRICEDICAMWPFLADMCWDASKYGCLF